MVVRWGWVPVLMVADWAGFIIDLGFFFFFSLLWWCGWLLWWFEALGFASNNNDGFFSLSFFLIWNLDLVPLVVVCAYIRCWFMLAWWLVVADLFLDFQEFRTIQTLENVLLKMFYWKYFTVKFFTCKIFYIWKYFTLKQTECKEKEKELRLKKKKKN